MGEIPPRVVIEISSSDDEDETDAVIMVGSSTAHKRIKDDNDVVIIASVSCSNGKVSSPVSKKVREDDCWVLEGDPNRKAVAVDLKASDADDLILVGDSGPIACRDYPHARHLCVKFPFKTTSHESHCEQCHCYVCDVLAPCLLWGTGDHNNDHCHAFDKDEKWKKLRKLLQVQPLQNSTSHPTPALDCGSGIEQSQPLNAHVQSSSCLYPNFLSTISQPGYNSYSPQAWAFIPRSFHVAIPNLNGCPLQDSSPRLHAPSKAAVPRIPPHVFHRMSSVSGMTQYRRAIVPNAARIQSSVITSAPLISGMTPLSRTVTPNSLESPMSQQVDRIRIVENAAGTFSCMSSNQASAVQLSNINTHHQSHQVQSKSHEFSSGASITGYGAVPFMTETQLYSDLQDNLQILRDHLYNGIVKQRDGQLTNDKFCNSVNIDTDVAIRQTIERNEVSSVTPPATSDGHPGYMEAGFPTSNVNMSRPQEASTEDFHNFLSDAALDFNFPQLNCDPCPVLGCNDFTF